MADVRETSDALELVVSDDLWPLPKYREMLFPLDRLLAGKKQGLTQRDDASGPLYRRFILWGGLTDERRRCSMLVLAFLGGVLTILSPCILPIIPLVFARSGTQLRSRDCCPCSWSRARVHGRGAHRHRNGALADRRERRRTRHRARAVRDRRHHAHCRRAQPNGSRAPPRAPAPRCSADAECRRRRHPLRNVIIGMAIGLLWAPCAGPILGVLIAARGHHRRAACRVALSHLCARSRHVARRRSSRSVPRLIARIKRAGATETAVRRVLGVATIVTVHRDLLRLRSAALRAREGS